jgi:septal ring factor EnvC (AmiA/AmiB activator)
MGTPYGDIILYQGEWGNVTDEDEGDSDDLPVSQYMDTKEQDLIAMEIELNKKENRLNKEENRLDKKKKRLEDWEKRLNNREKRLNTLRKNMVDIIDGEEE